MLAPAPVEKPTPAGPSKQSTLAARFQWCQLILKLVVLRVNVNSPLEYSQLCRIEQPGPGDKRTINGSFDGLLSERVYTQQMDLPLSILRQPAKKPLTVKSMGSLLGSTQSPSSSQLASTKTVRRISHFIMIDIVLYSISINCLMFKLILVLLLSLVTQQQVDHSPIVPAVVNVKIQPNISLVPSRHSFSTSFDFLGFEISGSIFQTNNGLLNDEIHNSSFYSPSHSCTFYNSALHFESIHDITMLDGWEIQSSAVLKDLNTVVLIMSNDNYLSGPNQTDRLFVQYSFDQDSYEVSEYNFSASTIGLDSSEEMNIQIAAVGMTLMATDGSKIIVVNLNNSQNSRKLQYTSQNSTEQLNNSQILKFQLYQTNNSSQTLQMMIVTSKAIRIYNVDLKHSQYTLQVEFLPPQGKYYTDAIKDGHNYYALIQSQMVSYRYQQGQTFDTSYIQLESKYCWQLQKYSSTLHMICQQSGLNYVAEFFFNQSYSLSSEALKLNRYYNQIDDAKLLFKFGGSFNPKLMITGDNDLMLTAYGINRQVLLQTINPPTTNRLKGLGLNSITTIDNFSTDRSTYAVGISTGFLVFFKINQSPAEMECFLERKQAMIRWNVLVIVNTTSCLANGDIEQLQSICSTAIPYTMYVSLFEIDGKKSSTFTIIVFGTMAILGLLLLICFFYCKEGRKQAFQQIRDKLAKLTRKKGLRSI